ncbi:MAG: hypothetical protein IKF80_04105 [Erysipelotrichaceae bacterium]|nr:hypothetical protein [Erysipelotrichaceae bacterium]
MWFLLRLFTFNGDALIALPKEAKIFMLAALGFSFFIGLFKGLFFLIKFILIIAIIYFALTWVGVF